MLNRRVSLKRTVFYDEESGELCQCEGEFWKTCSLRVANELPCQEAIVSITPINRNREGDPAPSSVRSIDTALADLEDGLRHLNKKLKI